MGEQYTAFELAGTSLAEWFCESISDDQRGLAIRLTDPASKRHADLIFSHHIAYRNVREEVRMRTLLARAPLGTSGLYTVADSEWLAWLRTESGGPLDDRPLIHYALFTDEDCIDVAAEIPPSLQFTA